MTDTKTEMKTHPMEAGLADFLDNSLPAKEKLGLEAHIAGCGECLEKIVSAYEAVAAFRKDRHYEKRKVSFMKKINIYPILAVLAFALSFSMPQYFMQLLVATLLLGIKWIADSKSTKMLVMIYEAWKKGEDKEVSKILHSLDSKKRF